jgi:VWFA-related protein
MVVLGVVALAAIVGAQEESQPLATFFAPLDVPLISVEVYVSDKSGKPMPGLTVEDFEVFEDGKPVAISHFYASPGVAGRADDRVEVAEEQIEDAPGQDLFLVIYFEDTNLVRGRRQAAIEYLREFLNSELPQNLKVMLVRFDGGLRVEQEFTEDTDEVVKALGSLEKSASNSRQLDEDRMLREMENATTAAAVSGSQDSFLETRGSTLLQEINSYSEQVVQRTKTSLANQQQLIRSLSGLSGRKAMLVVTDGVETRPGELLYRAWGQTFESVPSLSVDARRAFLMASRNDLSNEFDKHARFANGHRVSFYNLSSMGSGQLRGMSAESRLMDEQGLFIEQGMNEDVNMAFLAGTTGGRTLVNSPALSEQLDEVSVELASYYSLAFEPSHVGDGKYHRLEVKVAREGAKLRHRDGYLDVPQSERMTDRTLAAAVHGIGDNPLGINVSNGEITARDDGTYLVPVIITVPIGQLVLIPSEEEHQGQISILLTVRNERGDLSPPQRREYPVPVRNADLTAALGQNAGFTLRLAVRPGKQRIAVGVRDEIAQTESVTTLEVDVGATGGAES